MKKLDLSLSAESQHQFSQILSQITNVKLWQKDYLSDFATAMCTCSRIPKMLTGFVFIYNAIQFMVIGALIPNKGANATTADVIIQASALLDFFTSTELEFLAGMVLVLLGVGSLLWFWIHEYLYTRKSVFSKLHFAVSEILVDAVMPCIIAPIATVSGEYAHLSFDSATVVTVIMFILLLAVLIGLLYTLVSVAHYTKNSVFIGSSWMASWNDGIVIIKYAALSVFAFIVPFSDAMGTEIEVFIDALLLIGFLSLAAFSYWMPYVYILGNAGLLAEGVTGAIIVALGFVPESFFSIQYIFFTPLVYLAIVVGGYYLVSYRETKIIEAHEDLEQILRIAFKRGASTFINGTVIDEIVQLNNEKDLKLQVARLACPFTKFDTQLTLLQGQLSNGTNFSKGQDHLLNEVNAALDTRQSLFQIDKLDEMRTCTTKLTADICSFWKDSEAGIPELMTISKRQKQLDSLWEECIMKHPNNVPICQGYSTYLLETKSDYEGAAEWMFKANKLQLGFTFQLPMLTMSLLKAFPVYADEAVANSNIADQDELDNQMKETLLNSVTNDARLRLELQHAFGDKKSSGMGWFNVAAILEFCIGIFTILTLYIVFEDWFQERADALQFISTATGMRVYAGATLAAFNLKKLSDEGKLPATLAVEQNGFFDLTKSWIHNAIDYIRQGRSTLQYFTSNLTTDLVSSPTLLPIANIMNKVNKTIVYFDGSTFLDIVYLDLRTDLTYYYAKAREISSLTVFPWATMSYFYEMQSVAASSISELSAGFAELEYTIANEKKLINVLVPLILAGIYFICSIPFELYSYHRYKKDLLEYSELIRKLDQETIDEAGRPLAGGESSTKTDNKNKLRRITKSKHKMLIGTTIISVFINVLFVVVLGIYAYINQYYQSIFIELNNEIYLFGKQTAVIIETVFSTVGYYGTDMAYMQMVFSASLQSSLTFLGSPHTSAFDEAQAIIRDKTCTEADDSLHSWLVCASLTQGITLLNEYLQRVVQSLGDVSFLLDSTFANFFDLVTCHLYQRSDLLNSKLVDLGQEYEDTYDNMITLVLVIVVFASIGLLVFNLLKNRSKDQLFSTLVSIILRTRPNKALDNKAVFSVILGNEQQEKGGANHSIYTTILGNDRPILVFNTGCTILRVNPLFKNLLGYDTAQVIGQPLEQIISPESAMKTIKTFIRMEENRTAVEGTVVSESATELDVTIDAIYIGTQGVDKLYALVLTDNSSNHVIQEKIKDIKAENEALLAGLNPEFYGESREIHPKEAIIICIRLCDITLNNSPAEICNIASTAYSLFENCLEEYPNIHKLYILNEVFYAVSIGQDATKDHIDNAVSYALKVQEAFEEHILIGGICISFCCGDDIKSRSIGKTRRRFYAEGETLKTAKALIRRCETGTITMCKNTYEYLASKDYRFYQVEDELIGSLYVMAGN